MEVSGIRAMSLFAHESGKHCVQRVPPSEKRGRRHTSMISVVIMPVREKSDYFDERDVEISTQRGHGKGGQNQNKVESAVRANHGPSGLAVFINGRDQYRNRRTALEILRERVEAFYGGQERVKDEQERKAQRDYGSRSNKTRTYNFIDGRIVDHSLGVKKFVEVDRFLRKGDLSIFYPNEENLTSG